MRHCWVLLLLLCSHAVAEQPKIVCLIAESEYQTQQSLSEFAKQHLGNYDTTFVYASPDDKNHLVGIEAVQQADVLLVSVRRRTLAKDQLDYVRNYIAAGKPVIGIRTANHAFCLRGKVAPAGKEQWESWDKDVFGGNYTNHYGNDLKTTYVIDAAASAKLVNGIANITYTSAGSLYQVAPLADGASVLMTGSVAGHPPEPIAWTFTRADGGKSFYTSLGHVDDFHDDALPKLLVNAIKWALQKP